MQAGGCWRLARWFFLVSFLIGGLLAVSAGVGAYFVYQDITHTGLLGAEVSLLIPKNLKGNDVGVILTNYGFIKHRYLFRLAIYLDTNKKPIKSGPYLLNRGMAAMDLLHQLQAGPNRPYHPWEIPPDCRFVIPEGLSVAQMARLFPNPDAFLEAVHDRTIIAKLRVKVDSLEGYLMPSTYLFESKPTEHAVVVKMVENFQKAYNELLRKYPSVVNRDMREIVTVASLVEEEAKVPEDRPLIAAVVYNRLKKKMPLQIDATIQYALKKYGERILLADLQVDSPYNTYKVQGLPAGPISNPGIPALEAAMNPAEVDYLYYVVSEDGVSHTFSTTKEEHEKAVAVYRKEVQGEHPTAQMNVVQPPVEPGKKKPAVPVVNNVHAQKGKKK